MIDPTRDIRVAYGQLLNGNITLQGRIIPVVDRVSEKEPHEYIRISEQTMDPDPSTTGCHVYETTILFDVVTSFAGKSQGGKHESDLIADQLIQLCFPESEALPDLGPRFQMIDSKITMNVTAESQGASRYYVRRLIRLENLVEQL
jgi:hypothetical protein